MDRSDLHRLIESLPEGAFESAGTVLEHLQVWPPQPPPEIKRMEQFRQEQMEKMSQSLRPGTTGGGGGGGEIHPGGYGHTSHSRIEDGTSVLESLHFYDGHEIAVVERLKVAEDKKSIRYTHEAKGPKGEMHVNEIVFDV
jgi:hypothetical protein